MGTDSTSFAQLFKKYRLLSGFATIGEFADALAEEGIVYDESLISKWQRGSRVPSREVMLILIKVFAKNCSLFTPHEANELLERISAGHLTDGEENYLFSDYVKTNSQFSYKDILEMRILSDFYLDLFRSDNAGSLVNDVKQHKESIMRLVELCVRFNSYEYIFSVYGKLSEVLWQIGDWKCLEIISSKLLNLAKIRGKPTEVAGILVKDLAWLKIWQGEFFKAEDLLNEGSIILSRHKDTFLSALLLHRMGVFYYQTNKMLDSKNKLQQALIYFQQTNNLTFSDKCKLYLAEQSFKEGKVKTASVFLSTIQKSSQEYYKAKHKLGNFKLALNKYEEARAHFFDSLSNAQKNGMKAGEAWAELGLAETGLGKKFALSAAEKFQTLGMTQQYDQAISFLK